MSGAPPAAVPRLAPGPWAITALLFVAAAAQLRVQGRLWWCACGGWNPWSGDTWSRHNSQHLADAYLFSHVLHGFLFAGALAWLTPRLAAAWRLAISTGIETAWEIIENTEFVINRYREVTASLDYRGDTVANSLGDILGCTLGFWLARVLGPWRTVAIAIAVELVMLGWIRDNLTLNVLMLLWPVPAIREWQSAL